MTDDCDSQGCDVPAEWSGLSWKNLEVSGRWCTRHRREGYKTKRIRCENCGKHLAGRQRRWCSRICDAAFQHPSYLWKILLDRQDGLCGICVKVIAVPAGWDDDLWPNGLSYWSPPGVEVDHVVPRSKGGPGTLENLRASHRKCNQAKKARPLDEYRWVIGAFEDEVSRRLEEAAASHQAAQILAVPRVPRDPEWFLARAEPASIRQARAFHPTIFAS